MNQILKIRPTLPKSMILRGYDSFSAIFQKGEVIRGAVISCHFAVRASSEEKKELPVQIGFAVPKRLVQKAAERNRIRRIFREIFRQYKEPLVCSALSNKVFLNIVIVLSRRKTEKNCRLNFESVLRDWQQLLPKIESRLGNRS